MDMFVFFLDNPMAAIRVIKKEKKKIRMILTRKRSTEFVTTSFPYHTVTVYANSYIRAQQNDGRLNTC